MRNFRPLTSAFVALFLLAGCDAPVETPPPQPINPEPEPATETETADDPKSEPTKDTGPATGAAATPEDPTTPEEKEEPRPLKSVASVLDIKREGDQLVITGHFQSQYQIDDIVAAFEKAFPELKVNSEGLDIGPHVKTVGGWGNRISVLLVPFFMATGETGHFRNEAGITTLEGTVEKKAMIRQFQQHTVNIMSDYDAVGIENNLKAAE